jgi:hypothetical protein
MCLESQNDGTHPTDHLQLISVARAYRKTTIDICGHILQKTHNLYLWPDPTEKPTMDKCGQIHRKPTIDIGGQIPKRSF